MCKQPFGHGGRLAGVDLINVRPEVTVERGPLSRPFLGSIFVPVALRTEAREADPYLRTSVQQRASYLLYE